MIQRCEHCGQTVITTDQQCWHCGKALSRGKPQAVKRPTRETAVAEAATMPSFPMMLLYAGLTIMVLLMLIITTHALGQAPLFLLSNNNRLQAGWHTITDGQLQFTLNLPNEWSGLELAHAPEAADLRSSPPLLALENLLGAWVADSEMLFLGTKDTAVFAEGNPVFVLVTQSQRLQRVDPDELVSYLEKQLPENVTLSRIPSTSNEDEAAAKRLLFNIEQEENIWRCHQQINPGNDSIYFVFACSSFTQFPAYLADFEIILRSFQPLDS